MTEATIWDYLIQTIHGLNTLHTMGILHRDLKCANLFINASNILKIGDLNVSKISKQSSISSSSSLAKTQTGTPYYTAPEIWKGESYTDRSDVWSLGCILYELCQKQPPFTANTIQGLFLAIIKGEYPPISS